MSEHLNLQPVKTSKIFGVLKMGANNTDKQVIRQLQLQGYNEHEIQHQAGVHYLCVRSFMQLNDPNYKETQAPITPETQHLHDRIAELEKEKDVEHRKEADQVASDAKAKDTRKNRTKATPKSNPKPQAASAVTADDY